MQAQPLSLPAVPEPVYGERLKNKAVIITGAAQGIGEAIVACFQAQQARLVIADIQADKVEKVAAHWRERGAEIHAQAVDITSKAQWQALVDTAIERFGRVDVLVNCAGVNVFRDPLEMTDEDWRRCFAIDLDGAWYGCRSVLPHMIEQGIGNIINIASTHSSHIIPGCFPYPVAKHGLLGLTRPGRRIRAQGHPRECDCAGLYRNPAQRRLLEYLPRPPCRAPARVRPAPAQAHRPAHRGGDDRAVSGYR